MVRASHVVGLILFTCIAQATTRDVTCSGGGNITSAMNSAISSSIDGDIVNISAGSCTMDRLNSISDKNITIQGQGKASTLITADTGLGQIISNGSKAPQWVLKGFTLSGTTGNTQAIVVWADAHASWRGSFSVHDVELYYPNNTGQGMAIYGPTYGVISRTKYTGSEESAILFGVGLTDSLEAGTTVSNLKGTFNASTPFTPGAANMLYIEDCEFVGTHANGIAAIDTNRWGGRVVFRHNTLTRAALYAHWTSDNNWNAMWWEVYNNTFDWSGGTTTIPVMRMQGGGTGLIYNNTIKGFLSSDNEIRIGEDRLGRGGSPLGLCSGSNSWDGNTDASAPGWPCLAQTGRDAGKTMAQIQAGDKAPSFPLYIWNNGTQDKCSNPNAAGAACDNSMNVNPLDAAYFKNTAHSTSGFGNGDVDWCKSASQPSGCGTHTLTYTRQPYPHPQRVQRGPAAPTLR